MTLNEAIDLKVKLQSMVDLTYEMKLRGVERNYQQEKFQN